MQGTTFQKIFIPIVSHWSDIRNQSSPKKNTKSNNTTTKFAGKSNWFWNRDRVDSIVRYGADWTVSWPNSGMRKNFFFAPQLATSPGAHKARQGAEGNSRHSDRNIILFPSWSG